MADNSILIEFMLDDAKFKQEADKSKQSIDKLNVSVQATKGHTKDAETGFKGMQGAIESALLKFEIFKQAASAAAEIFKGVFLDGVTNASKTQDALQKVADALGRTRQFSTAALQDMDAFASSLEKTTGKSDDLILSAASLAISFGQSEAQAKVTTKAALDLSAAMGVDLDTAVKELSETYEGHLGKIGKLIPAAQSLTQEQLKNGDAVRLAAAQFDGAASGALLNYSGALLQLQVSFENFGKALGKTVTENPAVQDAIRTLANIFDGMGASVERNAGKIRNFVAEGLLTLIKTVREAVAIFNIFTAAIKTDDNPFKGMESSTKAIRDSLNDSMNIVDTIAVAILEAQRKIAQLKENAYSVFNSEGEGAAKASKEIASIDAQLQAIANRVTTIATPTGTSKVSDLAASLQPGAIKSQDYASPLLDKLDKLANSIQGGISNGTVAAGTGSAASIKPALIPPPPEVFKPIIDDFRAGFDHIGVILEAFGETLGKVGDAIADSPIFKGVIQGGQAGAQSAVGGVAGQLASLAGAGGPLAGGIASLFQVLGSDPKTFKNMIEGFVNGIPIIIDNIVKNLPVLIQTLVSHIPEVIVAIVTGIPKIVVALVEAFSNPQLYLAVVRGLLQAMSGGLNFQADKFSGAGDKLKEGVGKAVELDKKAREIQLNAFKKVIDGVKETVGKFVEFDKKIRETINKLISEAFDKVKEVVGQFVAFDKKIRETINNVIGSVVDKVKEAVGAFVEFDKKIREALGNIIGKIVDFDKKLRASINDAIQRLFEAIGKAASSFFDKIKDAASHFFDTIKDAAASFFNTIIDAISSAVDKLKGGGGGGGGFATQQYHKVLGHATGGTVPGGFPNDSYPAFLESGETVLPQDDVRSLRRYLAQSTSQSKSDDGLTTVMLSKILDALHKPQDVSTAITIDGRKLADVILSLNRGKQRLA